MPQKDIAGTTIEIDDDGYMTNRDQWNRDIADALAAEAGITLTDAHWKVLDFIIQDFEEKGAVPGIRRIKKVGGIPTKDLYALFPDGPVKKAAKISGHGKPTSCV
jgi:tRNA 2-thiouridine synthesizing protein E